MRESQGIVNLSETGDGEFAFKYVSVVADDPLLSGLKFFEGRAAYNFHFALDVARRDDD